MLSPSTPLGLLRNVWYHTTLFWCRSGREGQRRLTSESFKFLFDENNRPYATMAHDESSRNHPGGITDPESFEKNRRMYRTSDDPSDGYNALRFYISKLNSNCEAFYQYPRRKWSAKSLTWFENRPLGVNKLGCMMKEISEEAQLSQLYTNHCVRATAITLWSIAGLSNRHIMAISGHRNEQSLKSYNSRPSSIQLQQSSDVLSRGLSTRDDSSFPSEINESTICRQLPCSRPCSSKNLSAQTNPMIENTAFANLFSGCSIGSVQINFSNCR